MGTGSKVRGGDLGAVHGTGGEHGRERAHAGDDDRTQEADWSIERGGVRGHTEQCIQWCGTVIDQRACVFQLSVDVTNDESSRLWLFETFEIRFLLHKISAARNPLLNYDEICARFIYSRPFIYP